MLPFKTLTYSVNPCGAITLAVDRKLVLNQPYSKFEGAYFQRSMQKQAGFVFKISVSGLFLFPRDRRGAEKLNLRAIYNRNQL